MDMNNESYDVVMNGQVYTFKYYDEMTAIKPDFEFSAEEIQQMKDSLMKFLEEDLCLTHTELLPKETSSDMPSGVMEL
jgi:hypothetical protein